MRFNAKLISVCFVCLIAAFSSASVLASPTASLSWYRNNGYVWDNDIGGQWTVTAQVSDDVTRVEFYVDNVLQQNSTASPFKFYFNTADYTLGIHTVKAVAYTAEGQTATAQADRNFVEYSTNILFVIAGVVVAVMAVALAVLLYRVRRREKKKKT